MLKFYLSEYTIEDAISIVDNFISKHLVNKRNARKLRLIYEELVTNIFKYAANLHTQYVYVSIEESNENITLYLKYDGDAFDPTKYKTDTNKNLNDMKIGGLGLFLVEKMSKTFQYQRKEKENVITIEI